MPFGKDSQDDFASVRKPFLMPIYEMRIYEMRI